MGVPSLFVRLDTCNLRCRWGETLCDAHYTSWTPGEVREEIGHFVDRVEAELEAKDCGQLVITGGEPMLQAEVVQELCRMTSARPNTEVTIETNGTVFVSCAADLICLSPKLKSSTPLGTKYEKMHSHARWNPVAIRGYMEQYNYYFKFVLDREQDVLEIMEMLMEVGQDLPDPSHVIFMPQGVSSSELNSRGRWIAEVCKRLGVRYTPRLQIDLWGNRPGT